MFLIGRYNTSNFASMASADIDKQEARQLFMMGWEQTRIAKVIGRTEQTINKWCKDGQWYMQRDLNRSKFQGSKDLITQLLHHQLDVLHRIAHKKKLELEATENPTIEELEKLLINSKEADLVAKFFAQIRDQENHWDKLVSFAADLVDFLQSKDLELAKNVLPLIDAYVKSKRSTES